MELSRNTVRYLRLNKFLYSSHRYCVSDSSLPENKQIVPNNKNKKKLTVLHKKIPLDPSLPPKIIESREASNVIKHLNRHFKLLYGPLLTPCKTNSSTRNKPGNWIIQSQTVIPISEPKGDSKLVSEIDLATNQNEKGITHVSSILSFPLLNQQSPFSRNSELKVNEINSLRVELESKSESYIPSVSKILEKTMPPERVEILKQWKERMIKELGEEGFMKYRAELFENGQNLHLCINNRLIQISEEEFSIDEAIAGHWKSLKAVFPEISDVRLLEERVSHPFLRYKGVVDCFAQYKNRLVVIDWKTSKKKKYTLSSTYDNPLQIAAYVGALNFDPRYQYLVKEGLIVVAYEDGSRASVHLMTEDTMKRYWKEWLMRVKTYWESTEKSDPKN